MEPQKHIIIKKRVTFSLYLKCGAIFLLFLLSALVVACGTNTNAAANLKGPVPTVTIKLGNSNLTPTPTLTPYFCGAWITNTTPAYGVGSIVVNAKFTQNVAGNAVGVPDATAQATVSWGDGSVNSPAPVQTTRDGLATITITVPQNRPVLMRAISLVTVQFSAANTPGCKVDTTKAAFFVFIMVSPTATPSPSPTATPQGGGNNPTATPTSTTIVPTFPPGPPGKGPKKTPTPTP